MTALICGSVAFDTIMQFPDRFRDHILADRVEEISVCFTAPEMRREFGGCAGNVAYTLKLLGGDPLPMATVGHDFGPYASWMDRIGIDRPVRDRGGRVHRPGPSSPPIRRATSSRRSIPARWTMPTSTR